MCSELICMLHVCGIWGAYLGLVHMGIAWKSWLFLFWLVSAVLWGLHLDYIIRSLDRKCHDAPHFDHLDPRDLMVPLIMLLASHYTSASNNSVTWPKSHVTPHFSCLNLRNAMVPLMKLLTACDTNASAISVTWWKSCCTSFWSFWLKECNGAIDGAVHITWCWHQCIDITWH